MNGAAQQTPRAALTDTRPHATTRRRTNRAIAARASLALLAAMISAGRVQRGLGAL